MERRTAKITSKGQVTLPVAGLEALHVGTGDVVTFEILADGVNVVSDRRGRFSEYIGKYRAGKGKTAEEVDSWLRELRGR